MQRTWQCKRKAATGAAPDSQVRQMIAEMEMYKKIDDYKMGFTVGQAKAMHESQHALEGVKAQARKWKARSKAWEDACANMYYKGAVDAALGCRCGAEGEKIFAAALAQCKDQQANEAKATQQEDAEHGQAAAVEVGESTEHGEARRRPRCGEVRYTHRI